MNFAEEDDINKIDIATNKLSNSGINIIKNSNTDLIADRYRILCDSPLDEYNNYFAKAYMATDIQSNRENLYALAFDSKMPLRLTNIINLKKNINDSFITPLEAEITKLSTTEEEHLVIILQKPQGISLEEYIIKNGPCSANFIIEKILTPLTKILLLLDELNVAHCNINHKNVFISENDRLILGDCVATLSGFDQLVEYEPLERVDLLNFAKGEGDNKVDTYAIGMLCLYSFLGKMLVLDNDKELNNDMIVRLRLMNGSFYAMSSDSYISPLIKDLIKGLMSDKKPDRWGTRNIIEWLQGKSHTIIASNEHIEASRHVIFNGNHYFNRKAISHDLFKQWDDAKRFLKEDHLIKWIERSVNDTNSADKLTSILKKLYQSRSSSEEDLHIAKILMELDPSAIIRLNNFAIHIESIGNLVAIGYARSKRHYLDFFRRLIVNKLWRTAKDYAIMTKTINENIISNISWKLDRADNFIHNNNFGFGMERCLYDTNPDLPCQSPLLKGKYINSLIELITYLEKIVLTEPEHILDKHIAAFIASKLDLINNLTPDVRPDIIKFTHNKEMITIAYFSTLQKKAKIAKLPNLCNYIAKKLNYLVDLLRSKTLKEELSKKLKSVAEDGNLIALFKVAGDLNYMKKDVDGFKQAVKQYNNLKYQINQLKHNGKVYEVGYRYGLRISVVASYLICSAVFIMLITQYIN